MPDTPGKRQRNMVKAKKREAKEERRAARKSGRQEPVRRVDDEQPEDQQGVDAGLPGGDIGETRPPDVR